MNEKKTALIDLLKFTNLISDSEKDHMITHIGELTEEQIDALGTHLAMEAQGRIEKMEAIEMFLEKNVADLQNNMKHG